MEVEIETSPKTNGQELSPKLMEIPEIKNSVKENQQSPETPKRVTRSRSKTPKKQPKKTNITTPEMEKIVESAESKVNETNGDSTSKTVEETKTENENLNGNIEEELKAKTKEKVDQVEMDPLVLNNDEPDPELEFDETSDMDSATGSPTPSRCRTRRSLTRNIPTPKTPKTLDNDPEPEIKSNVLDHTYDSIDVKDLSTKAEVGGDSTRLNFEESMGESFLESCKNRSIRGLSARRSIRPTNDVYLRAIRNNHERSELNLSCGMKRKNRSETPEDRKRMKTGESSSSLLSMISSPFLSIKNKFTTETTSSTPKLMGYKDENGVNYADDQIEIEGGLADKKNWCTLM